MSYKDTPPAQAAEEFFKAGLTIEQYKKLQEKRKNSYLFFKTTKVKVLMQNTKALYEYGEQVLTHIEKLYKTHLVVTLVQVEKTHAWSAGKKGYIFPVVQHEDATSRTKAAKEKNKTYWQVLKGDYSYQPVGFKVSTVKSPFLLSKKDVKVIGTFVIPLRNKK